MTQVGNTSRELRKEYLGMHETLQQLRPEFDITCGESKVDLLSKIMEIVKQMPELEEHAQKLHEGLNNELTTSQGTPPTL